MPRSYRPADRIRAKAIDLTAMWRKMAIATAAAILSLTALSLV